MKKILTIGLLALFACINAFSASQKKEAEKGSYNIKLTAKDYANQPAYLGFYYNGKTYTKDTTQLNNKGVGTFKKNKVLDQGIYIIYFNSDKFFDIFVGKDQDIEISADSSDRFSNINVKGGIESVEFQNLIDFMQKKHHEQKDLAKSYKDKKIDSTSYMDKSKRLTEEVTEYQQDKINKYKGLFISSFIKGTIQVETPEYNEVPDSLRYMARYQYTKNHFFDNIDLKDPRFLRTPYFPNKVDTYISKYVIQHPDSITDAAIKLIEKTRGNDETFQTMTSKMLNYGLQSKIMGMDKVWLRLADKYYLSGEATWADSSWINDLKKECEKVRYNLIGDPAHNLIVRDSNDAVVQLRDLKQELVLVYLFEPSCGHCKKTTPILHDSIYTKFKDKGFEVFCFYIQTDRKEWMDFINKNKLTDWVNVWDPQRESWFWKFYDSSSTPGVYLLDKERKFLAKKIDMKTLDMILTEELINKKKEEK